MLSKINILGSSSSGNAYVLTFDNGKTIQLDAGVKNPEYKKVDKLYISHHHIDHDKFIEDYDKDKIIEPIAESTFSYYHTNLNGSKIVTNGYEIIEDGEDIVYLTDCGDRWSVKPKFPKATLLIIECNWDWFGIKQGVIKQEEYGERALSKGGHLSNLDCLNLIAYLGINKDCKIIFVHRSSHHGSDNMYKIFDCLPNKKYIAKKGETLYVKSWKAI